VIHVSGVGLWWPLLAGPRCYHAVRRECKSHYLRVQFSDNINATHRKVTCAFTHGQDLGFIATVTTISLSLYPALPAISEPPARVAYSTMHEAAYHSETGQRTPDSQLTCHGAFHSGYVVLYFRAI
jgi:hypothetical protein